MKKKNQKKIQKKGFTLIELLVVATIIVVLSAIGLVSFTNAGKTARNSKRKSDMETVRQALVLYKSDTGAYPDTNYGFMISILSSGYISSPTPVDPKTGQTSCGLTGTTVCDYVYTGSDTTFVLTAPLEGLADYTVSNP